MEGAAQPYANAAQAQVAQGKLTTAESTLTNLRRKVPGARNLFNLMGALAAARGDFDRAEAYADSARQLVRGDPVIRANVNAQLAALSALRGKLARWSEYRHQVALANEERGLPGLALAEAVTSATVDLRFRDAPAAAIRRIEAAVAKTPFNAIAAGDRPYVVLARQYAAAGRPEPARRLLTEYQLVVDEWFRLQNPGYPLAVADLALAEGRLNEAIAKLRQYLDGPRCELCGLFELARAYDRAGQGDSAIAYYERLVATPSQQRIGQAWSSLPQSFKRLGELYEANGSREKAAEYYGRFADLWKGADPELQPVVRDVKNRLARLVGEK
jgi:predicted Zn-dependent protease